MIRLSGEQAEAIRAHGRWTYPEECCGVLLGTVAGEVRRVQEVMQLDNARTEERHRRFLITSHDYTSAEQAAAARGLELIGFYHSHPDHPARPSQYDLEHALPWHSYIVLAVQTGEPQDMNSWIMADDRSQFLPEELAVGLTQLQGEAS